MPGSSTPPGPRVKPLPGAQFGRQCLRSCRLAEAGVRYLQVNYTDSTDNPRWDQHSNLAKHAEHAHAVDHPVAAILADLEERGPLDDTLVWWGGEFVPTPSLSKPKGWAGGETGIRTQGDITATHDFESCALNRTQPSLRLADGNLKAVPLPCKGEIPTLLPPIRGICCDSLVSFSRCTESELCSEFSPCCYCSLPPSRPSNPPGANRNPGRGSSRANRHP